MLLPPLDPHQIAAFSLTSTEKELKRNMLFPPDLGIAVNALNIERYSVPDVPQPLDPADAALLRDADVGAIDTSRRRPGVHTGRRRDAAGDVTWLMRTKYITNEASDAKRTVKLKAEEEMTEIMATPQEQLASQIEAIEASFAAARPPPTHPRNRKAIPVEILPVLPDEFLDGWSCVLATFDGNPTADVDKIAQLSAKQRSLVEQAAQLKSFVRRRANGSLDRFVSLMLPRKAPVPASGDAAQGGSVAISATDLCGDYDWVREYDSTVRYDERGQTYLFRVTKDYVGYQDLNTKVGLRKRKRATSKAKDEEEDAFIQPEKFVVALPSDNTAEDTQREKANNQPAPTGTTGLSNYEDGAGAAVQGRPAGEGDDGGSADATNANTAALMRDVFGSDDDDE